MSSIVIRDAKPEDVDAVSELVVRLKRLNGEFDPLLTPRDDLPDQARKYVEGAIARKDDHLVLVLDSGGRVVGALIAMVRERMFYHPPIEGVIIDFYLMPEFRRKGYGAQLLEKAVERLREMGAQIITAEFPLLNTIAVEFYRKMGFRNLIGIYARET